MKAESDLGGIRQKILASGKTRGNIPPAKPFKMDVLFSIVKGKGVSNESAPPSKLATFTENSDAKRDHVCGSGGIGRRAGLRILWPQGRGGSTPPFRTNLLLLIPNSKTRQHLTLFLASPILTFRTLQGLFSGPDRGNVIIRKAPAWRPVAVRSHLTSRIAPRR